MNIGRRTCCQVITIRSLPEPRPQKTNYGEPLGQGEARKWQDVCIIDGHQHFGSERYTVHASSTRTGLLCPPQTALGATPFNSALRCSCIGPSISAIQPTIQQLSLKWQAQSAVLDLALASPASHVLGVVHLRAKAFMDAKRLVFAQHAALCPPSIFERFPGKSVIALQPHVCITSRKQAPAHSLGVCGAVTVCDPKASPHQKQTYFQKVLNVMLQHHPFKDI